MKIHLVWGVRTFKIHCKITIIIMQYYVTYLILDYNTTLPSNISLHFTNFNTGPGY